MVSAASSDAVDKLVQQVRSRIHDDIQCLHGTMPLWGISQPVPLSDLFVDVNLLEEPSSDRRNEVESLWQDFQQGLNSYSSYRSLDRIGLGREINRVSGLEILAAKPCNGRVEYPKLMVLGKPGSGKTTYLQRITTECNGGNLQAEQIPVLIQLRRFLQRGAQVGYDIKCYLVQQWQLSEVEVEVILRQGKAFVLLDGLDEITGENGRRITDQIQAFVETFPQNPVVITCRTQSHDSQFAWKSLGFRYVEVANFNREQVEAFAAHWFQAVAQTVEMGRATTQKFLAELFREEHKPIQDLAATPILLSLTCAVFQQTEKFHSKRSRLYEEGLELLLEKWDNSREVERDEIYGDLSVEQKLELLSHLAVKKFEQEQYVLFEQTEIEGYIADFLGIGLREARSVLRAIESQHGLLIERSQTVWSFSHLTFQEYLVAKVIVKSCSEPEPLRKIAIFSKSKNWREAFLIASEIMETRKLSVLLCLIKEEVDLMLKKDMKLQEFLVWLYQKTQLISSELKSVTLRAIYFCYELSLNLENDQRNQSLGELLNLACKLDEKLPESISPDLETGYNPLKLDNIYSNSLFYIDYQLICLLNLGLALTRGDYDFHCSPCSVYYRYYNEELMIKLSSIINGNEIQLQEKLNQLKLQMTYMISENYEQDDDQFEAWWLSNGDNWCLELRNIMIEYRDIAREWGFNEEQITLLKYCHYMTSLLLDCARSSNFCDEEFQRLLRGLFLPIAEIEKCKLRKSNVDT